MNKIFSNPTHKANVGYNGFDMSHTLKFSSTTGELLPVYRDFLQPGDKVSLSTELRTRTMPLETAAMGQITEYLDWFFVPITQIYQFFPEFYYGIQDFKTSFAPHQAQVSQSFPFVPAATFNNWVSVLKSANDSYFGSLTWFNGNIPLRGMGIRLAEHLGIPTQQIFAKLADDTAGFNMTFGFNPMFACAYQKIYFDYYRISDREQNDPETYNLDSSFDTGQANNVYNYLTMRYRPFNRDYFTSVQVSPLFGQTGTGSMSTIDLTKSFVQWLIPTDLRTVDSQGNANTSEPSSVRPATSSVSVNESVNMLRSAISPSAIRTSFAVEKLLEVTRRSGKHYDRQTLAHFGVDVPSGISGEVTYIGTTCKSDIQIGDVIATSTVPNGSALGQVGGKGYGYGQGSTLRFEAPCHGILMCIYSCVPVCDYPQLGYDKMNTWINTSSFPRPEFDNLGMQPIFNYETELDIDGSEDVSNTGFFGWQYRWSEVKTKYNRVVGGLMTGRSLSTWTLQNIHFGSATLSSYYCSPFELNNIMLVPFKWSANDSTSMSNPYATDPLIHQLYFDVRKSSKMSTYGLPSL